MSFRPVSLLKNNAKKLNVNLRNASASVLLELYRTTLIDIESFLDTSDLNLLTVSNIIAIRDDVFSIIRGLRSIRSDVYRFDRILDDLRNARDTLQVAIGSYTKSSPNLSRRFFSELRQARKFLHHAIQRLSGDVTTDAPPPPPKK